VHVDMSVVSGHDGGHDGNVTSMTATTMRKGMVVRFSALST